MAQHDYVIDNQSSPLARADINNALQAIVTQNSGATAPATTYANMFWYDTATNQVKKRNEANSAWIVLGTIDESTSKFTPNSALTTSGIDPATLVTASEGIASNNNDTTLPTSAAVVSYVPVALNASGSAPIYACRAWVNFNGTNPPSVRGSGNVSSVTYNATGDYTILFSTNMPDANYALSGSVTGSFAGVSLSTINVQNFGVNIFTSNTTGGFNPNQVHVAIFR